MQLFLCAAQTRCTTKRPINPNLTCICSQFGRENRPGAGDTACAHAVAPRPHRRPRGPLGPPRLRACRTDLGTLHMLFHLPFASSTRTSPGQLSTPLGSVAPHCTRCSRSPWDGSGPRGDVQGPGRLSTAPRLLRGLHSLLRFLCFLLRKTLARRGRFPSSIIGLCMRVN